MNFLKKRKFKNKNCIIHYEQDIFSNLAKIDIYGNNYDVRIGLAGIILSFLQRGNTIEDVREILDKIENNGNEVF